MTKTDQKIEYFGKLYTPDEFRSFLNATYTVKELKGYPTLMFNGVSTQDIAGRHQMTKSKLLDVIVARVFSDEELAASAARIAATPTASDEYKAWIAEKIIEFPEGCYEGKERFLKSVGLPVPPSPIVMQINITVPSDCVGLSGSDIGYGSTPTEEMRALMAKIKNLVDEVKNVAFEFYEADYR